MCIRDRIDAFPERQGLRRRLGGQHLLLQRHEADLLTLAQDVAAGVDQNFHQPWTETGWVSQGMLLLPRAGERFLHGVCAVLIVVQDLSLIHI